MAKQPSKYSLGPLLYDTLCIQSTTGEAESKMMEEYIMRSIEQIDPSIIIKVDKRNIYATKGDAALYPCAVAHTDTVQKIVEEYAVTRIGHLFAAHSLRTGKQIGVGGDDKVGVAMALACLRDMDAVKAVFFADEEKGCVGAKDGDLEFFKDVSFIIEADRQGEHDVVIAIAGDQLVSKEFCIEAGAILRRHDRDWASDGRPTDIGALKNKGLPICAINISCGYFNPHTDYETVSPRVANASYAFMRELFAAMGHQQWEHVRPAKVVVATKGGARARVPTWWPEEEYFENLDYFIKGSLEDAWVLRAIERHKAILDRNTVPNNYNGTSLFTPDKNIDGKNMSTWIMSKTDLHLVKRVPEPADLIWVSCPCCQFIGSLEIEPDPDNATATVVCDFCGISDMVIIGHQQFVGDFVTKDRSAMGDALLRSIASSIIQDADDELHASLEGRVHQGWTQHALGTGYLRDQYD